MQHCWSDAVLLVAAFGGKVREMCWQKMVVRQNTFLVNGKASK